MLLPRRSGLPGASKTSLPLQSLLTR